MKRLTIIYGAPQ